MEGNDKNQISNGLLFNLKYCVAKSNIVLDMASLSIEELLTIAHNYKNI